jgi:predicted sulfurtransferase
VNRLQSYWLYSCLGHFKGAELPNLNTFREFRGYAEELKEKVKHMSSFIFSFYRFHFLSCVSSFVFVLFLTTR